MIGTLNEALQQSIDRQSVLPEDPVPVGARSVRHLRTLGARVEAGGDSGPPRPGALPPQEVQKSRPEAPSDHAVDHKVDAARKKGDDC